MRPLQMVVLGLFVSLVGCGVPVSNSSRNASRPAGTEAVTPVTLTSAAFQQEVLGNSQVVMVDCWAPWCGPCRALGPVIDEIAGEFHGKAVVGKVNIDEEPDLAEEYEITSIPTLLFFKNGQLVDRIVGVYPKEDIVATLERHTRG